ncbi:Rhodopsin orphan GPCR [Paragonimus heterotremus]|uniref:Rhodopsin orphan GPCR n=1 Tax=Paragonimus heterotremus TaxID=100268 RepID=A0A8J4T9R6_9TREM|nr:Rhodopsin orphan GPCR [Paragonimus heterotremus]
MSATNESFVFNFLHCHHTVYLGQCEHVASDQLHGNVTELETNIETLGSIFLSLTAFVLNVISLYVFCVNNANQTTTEALTPQHHRYIALQTHTQQTSKTANAHQPVQVSNPAVKGQRGESTGKRTRTYATSRSSVTLSLMLLCLSECVFTLSFTLFGLLSLLAPKIVSPSVHDENGAHTMVRTIQVYSVLLNLIYFIGDTGLLCRNWCVCLITIARAEVVLWPLGSKSWQRLLRRRRRFFISFLFVLGISIILSYVKHADLISYICYQNSSMQLALWPEPFAMTERQYTLYLSYCYFVFQGSLVWCVITLFTIVIVVRLKPWKQEQPGIFGSSYKSASSKDSSRPPKGNQSIPVQIEAIKKRKKSQLRATRLVIVIVLLFLLLELFTCIATVLELLGVVESGGYVASRMEMVGNILVNIDSICNFIVFVATLKQFRKIFCQLACCLWMRRVFTRKADIGRYGNVGSNSSLNNCHTMVTTCPANRIDLD